MRNVLTDRDVSHRTITTTISTMMPTMRAHITSITTTTYGALPFIVCVQRPTV